MKIIAIWTRDKVVPKSRSIFILTSDGQFGEFRPEEKFISRGDNYHVEDTGWYEFWPEKPLVGDKWDFRQAHFFMLHIGGQLEWKEV
ncbi:MAG: hypothetical protein ACP5HC_06400 [Caldisericum sp.]